MREDELRAAFDRQAAAYDEQWEKMAPIRDGLYFLVESVFAELPADAKVLCVGVGTGAELAHLARRFLRWSFTAVEPSGPMLDLCRQRAEREGFASRCTFHEGYLDSLASDGRHHAATCFLVSQFILDQGTAPTSSVPSRTGSCMEASWPAPTWRQVRAWAITRRSSACG